MTRLVPAALLLAALAALGCGPAGTAAAPTPTAMPAGATVSPIAAAFARLDRDGDTILTPAETADATAPTDRAAFSRHAAWFSQVAGEDASLTRQEQAAAFDAWYRARQAEAAGQPTPAPCPTCMPFPYPRKGYEDCLPASFDRHDRNKDGALTYDEVWYLDDPASALVTAYCGPVS